MPVGHARIASHRWVLVGAASHSLDLPGRGVPQIPASANEATTFTHTQPSPYSATSRSVRLGFLLYVEGAA